MARPTRIRAPTSLRARLMLGLLALATVGLLVSDVASYTALRSYLMDRVDQQVQSAPFAVARTIVAKKVSRRARLHGPEVPGGGPGDLALPPDIADPPPEASPVSGVAGEIIGPHDRVVDRTPAYGGARPQFPAQPPVSSSPNRAQIFTVPASNGYSSDYRAIALELPDGSRILAAVSLSDVDQTLGHLRTIGLVVTAAILAALAVLAWWVTGIGLRPLRRMEQTANAIAAGDLSARVASPDERTEAGRLGVALNSMLAQIEQAFAEREASAERLRRFLADASHELRTPLASIRGYAEIFRTGAAREPEELALAMGRIEEEAARMGVLVGDLLALARLDEVREPRREPVDLENLAREVCEDTRAQAPGRAIDLRAEGPGEVLGDRDQLRQVLANLLRNAVVHTPSGTPIEVTVEGENSLVRVKVRDHGPGLEAGSEERVFDRFWRPHDSRRGDGAGAGLGLAIVAAITEAHGGKAVASNAAGGGAEFIVTLPPELGTP